MSNTIDVRAFVPSLERRVALPNGSEFPALWLDDVDGNTFNRIIAEEKDAAMDGLLRTRSHIKLLVPAIADTDLDSLTWRQLQGLESALKRFESQGNDDAAAGDAPVPLESAPNQQS